VPSAAQKHLSSLSANEHIRSLLSLLFGAAAGLHCTARLGLKGSSTKRLIVGESGQSEQSALTSV